MTNIGSQATGTYATVNGVRMYYEVHGAGRPLVLLHGGLHTIDLSFGALIPSLAESHRVIAVELQGHGRTADIARDPTIPNLADDIVALLDHLGLDRADLLGFSLGGLAALDAAIRHPERVDRLVLAAIHFRPDGYHDDIRYPEAHPDSVRMPTAADFAQMREEYVRIAPNPDHFDAFAAKQSAVVGAFDGWPPEQLRAMPAPTLLMIGDTDFVRIEHAAELLGMLPHAQLAVVPGTTHVGLMRRSDVVLPMIEEFLAQ